MTHPEGKESDPAVDDAYEPAVDPVEFLRAMLAISPQDAAEAREDAARAMDTPKE